MMQQPPYLECQRRLRGFFRARIRNLSDADELAQETWLTVLRQQDLYDPSRGSLNAFAISRARYCLLEYFRKTRDRRAMESLFCELQSQGTSGEAPYDPLDGSGSWGPGIPSQSEEGTWQTRLDYLVVVDRLLGLTCPPHQLMVFIMVWLLEATPREIDEGWSVEPLRRLEAHIETECGARWCLPESELQSKFRILRQRLAEKLERTVDEPRTRLTHEALLGRIAGDTLLRDYYTGAPGDNIVQWWYSVMRVLVKTFHRELRFVAPDEQGVERGE
jgi:DNA-directed RNA polymerase specialized sigma24 family protein